MMSRLAHLKLECPFSCQKMRPSVQSFHCRRLEDSVSVSRGKWRRLAESYMCLPVACMPCSASKHKATPTHAGQSHSITVHHEHGCVCSRFGQPSVARGCGLADLLAYCGTPSFSDFCRVRTQTASCLPAGCGCPPGWELGLRGPAPGEPQYRPADLVDFLLHRSFRNFQQACRPRI